MLCMLCMTLWSVKDLKTCFCVCTMSCLLSFDYPKCCMCCFGYAHTAVHGCLQDPLKCTCGCTHVRPAPQSVTVLKSRVMYGTSTIRPGVYRSIMAALYAVASVEVCGMLSTWCAEVCNQQFVVFVCIVRVL